MKILFTIPHFFDPQGSGNHGSVMKDPRPRLAALSGLIRAVHELFGRPQVMFDFPNRRVHPANQSHAHTVDVVVCTTRGRHLIEHLAPISGLFQHRETTAEPMLLGFECHAVQKEALGGYDYYCFLEDDIILHDPWLFEKLAWFNARAGNESLLQPYRFERSVLGAARRAYLGGPFPRNTTERYQNIDDRPSFSAAILGVTVGFYRTTNPHAGCYFLNAEQMAHWAAQPYFLDRDTSFIGPLESAASLGIMRALSIYKPAPEQASFFEVEHFGTGYLGLIGQNISTASSALEPVPTQNS